MTNLHCEVNNCGNNKDNFCCRPDIRVGGPRSGASAQTFCANFVDARDSSGMPQNAIDQTSPNPSLDIHCEAEKCVYNQNRACSADTISIRTNRASNGQIKTECASFQDRGGCSGR